MCHFLYQWLLVDKLWPKFASSIRFDNTLAWTGQLSTGIWVVNKSTVAASSPRACQSYKRQSGVEKHRLSSNIGLIPGHNFRSLHPKISWRLNTILISYIWTKMLIKWLRHKFRSFHPICEKGSPFVYMLRWIIYKVDSKLRCISKAKSLIRNVLVINTLPFTN